MIVDQSHREAAGTVNAFSRAPTRMLGYFAAHLLSGVDWERHLRQVGIIHAGFVKRHVLRAEMIRRAEGRQ